MSAAPPGPPAVYVILTSKPGVFETRTGPDLRTVETYDYVFFGRTKARFVIAVLERETKIVIVDEAVPATVNRVPSKLLARYASANAARLELEHLVKATNPDVALLRVPDDLQQQQSSAGVPPCP